MTEKQKKRRNKFNAEEDDIILADLDGMRDDEELSPVPLNHLLDDEAVIDRLGIDAEDKPEQTERTFPADAKNALNPDFHHEADFDDIPDDVDAIDRLLINTGFDENDEQEPDHTPLVDDLNLAGEDEFVLELIEQIEQNQQAETEEMSTNGLHHVVAFDDIADDEDAVFDAGDEQAQIDALMADNISLADQAGENYNAQSALVSNTAIVDPETSDAAAIVPAQEEKPETVAQEPAMIAGIKPELVSANPDETGTTALNHNCFEQEIIQKRLNACEHKVKITAAITYVSLAIGIIALMSTIAMGVMVYRMKTEISKLTELVSILEEDMRSITEKNPEMKFNNNDATFERLNRKVNNLSKQLQDQSPFTAETFKNKPAATVVRQATINKSPGHLPTGIHALEKKKPSEAIAKKISAKKQVQAKKAKRTHPAEDWSVNLVSYKEKSYAKSKAAKFIQKGVPAKVVAVDVNKVKVYRLKVGGFKNKLEATLYARKIKKSQNLSSVSVDNNS